MRLILRLMVGVLLIRTMTVAMVPMLSMLLLMLRVLLLWV